jgi:signal transduction histidine kinase
VRQHGGRLEARPRPGGGTVFQMTLPLSPARTEVA